MSRKNGKCQFEFTTFKIKCLTADLLY